MGWLQFREWFGIDALFQLRPSEPVDKRILLVGFTSEDMNQLKTSRLNDSQLAQLIKKVKQGNPRVIGVDIFRDFPVPPGHQELMTTFRTTPNLIGIGKQTGKRGDPDYDIIDPPPIPKKQIADVSAVLDGDDVQRRGFLYPVAIKQVIPSLGLALAYQYLEPQGIYPQSSIRGGLFDLGGATFYSFKNNTGVYVRTDDGSYQMLMNWRKAPFERVSVTDVLNGKVSQEIFREKVVVIGGYAPKIGDEFLTPFSRGLLSTPRKIYGMEAQAQITSEVLSAVLDGRPLVKVWREPWISIWSIGWGLITWAFITYQNRSWWKGLAFILLSTWGLFLGAYLAFLWAYWIPLIPPIVTIWLVGISLLILDYELGRLDDLKKIKQLNHKLKLKLDQRQVYRDLVILFNQIGSSITSPLQYLINCKTLMLKQEEILSETINQYIVDIQEKKEANVALAELATFIYNQSEALDIICFKLAKNIPNLEKLISLNSSSWERQSARKSTLKEAISNAINCMRPVIFDEYQLNLEDILTLNLSTGENEIISDPNKIIVFLNRIIEEVLWQSQLEDKPFPKINITIQEEEANYVLLISIARLYNPQELNLYFCQEILQYYGGTVSFHQKKGTIEWIALLPIN